MQVRLTSRPHRPALIAGTLLAALLGVCAWGGWVAAQPDFSTFILPGAHNIRYLPVGPGMQSVMFTYDGEVVPQTDRLYSALERRGWNIGQSPRREDCSDLCILGQFTLVFTRRSLFDLVNEVATVEQNGAGPYHVRVVIRRCIRLPLAGCWPPG